jgi:hypothetical protein
MQLYASNKTIMTDSSTNQEQRLQLKSLVESNAARIPILEEQLQRLQRVLKTTKKNDNVDDDRNSSKDDLNVLKAAETQLQVQKQEWQKENEQQIKAMDEIDRRLAEITPLKEKEQRLTHSHLNLMERMLRWSKKSWTKSWKPIVMIVVIYLLVRGRR